MSTPMRTSGDRPDGTRVPSSAGGGACLDDNLLAAFAERRLDPDRLERVQAHLSVCDACRAVACDLEPVDLGADAAPLEVGRLLTFRRPSRSAWFGVLALAGAVLLAVGLALQPAHEPEPAREQALRAAVEQARALRPLTLAGFAPLSKERLAQGEPPAALRGGIAIVRPAGVGLSDRPALAWIAAAGARAYRVRVYDAAAPATPLFERTVEGTGLAWPDDAPALPARALIEVSARAALGEAVGRREVQRLPDVPGFEADCAALAAAAPADALLLRAHLALERGLLEEAERAALAHLRAYPDDRLAQATLGHAQRRLGLLTP